MIKKSKAECEELEKRIEKAYARKKRLVVEAREVEDDPSKTEIYEGFMSLLEENEELIDGLKERLNKYKK